MGAENGATTSIFPFDEKMSSYLRITKRVDVAALAEGLADELCADKDVFKNPEKYYDQVIEINLSTGARHAPGLGLLADVHHVGGPCASKCVSAMSVFG